MKLNDLNKRYEDAIAVKQMVNSNGYKVFDRELEEFKQDQVNKLIESESTEARAAIKAISVIRKFINDVIAKGENARKEMSKGESQ